MATIGIFDSGIGGLSILQSIRARLPQADLVYYGDTANVPYGGRPAEDIERLSLEALEVVRTFQPDAVVVACNTATSVAIQKLRSVHSELPMIGVVPVIKKAAEASARKRIAVLATTATLTSHSYESLKRSFAHDVEVLDLALPEWVTMTENGDLESRELRASVASVSRRIQEFGADVVALGCTHFVFLRPALEAVLPGVEIMDSGEAVARQTERILASKVQLPPDGRGNVRYYCSGEAESFSRIATKLLGQPVAAERIQPI